MKPDSRKRDWSVLVVDDQINVVDGVIYSVHWDNIGVKTVCRAYSAAEAKTVLLQNPIDIMLCDIEMPQENGLQLFQWAKRRGLQVECIFLTAHADFLYAKSAVQLGGFDYILQPARYSEIENALLKAQQKILVKRERDKYYSLGKSVFQNRIRVTDDLFRDWYLDPGDSAKQEKVREYLAETDAGPLGSAVVCPALINIIRWHKEGWERELFRYSCLNILEELAGGENVHLLFHCLSDCLWGLWFWNSDSLPNEAAFHRTLSEFHSIASDFFSCDMAVFAGEAVSFLDAGSILTGLKRQKEDNVAMKSQVYFPGQRTDCKQESLPDEPDYHTWEALLIQGCGDSVCENAFAWLDQAAALDLLNAELLRSFYSQFVRTLICVEEATKVRHEEIFSTPELTECYFHGYADILSMKELIRVVCSFYSSEGDETKTAAQVDQIKEYIYHNLDRELRREEIASVFFLNPSYMSRIFKKEAGISLKDFIVQEKMKMARILLNSTTLPISIVAQRVGYINFSHFSQVYRRVYGISPTEERK